MTVTLIVQSDAGDVTNANAYHDLAFFKSYHDNRGVDYSAYTDQQLSGGIVRGTDFVDQRFNYRGVKLLSAQTTKWPRRAGSEILLPWWDINFLSPITDTFDATGSYVALVDPDNQAIVGIPLAIKQATAEYSLRALLFSLFQDMPAPIGGRWLQSESVKVDVIERSVNYVPAQMGGFAMPSYPAADLIISRAGLIEQSRQLMR